MRIYRERIPDIARTVVKALMDAELVEVEPEMRSEVELDLESVIKEYRRTDYELMEKAKDLAAMRNLDFSHVFKIKSQLASKQKFGLGEDAIEWIVAQMLEMLLQSKNVEEVFGEDHEIRRLVAPVLRKELNMESELDREVKKRIKNLNEGTADYDIEYQKALEKIRRSKGLSAD